jgi:hypothetical protein
MDWFSRTNPDTAKEAAAAVADLVDYIVAELVVVAACGSLNRSLHWL